VQHTTRQRSELLLRQTAGYVELGELLVDGDAPVPPSAMKLLERARRTLAELPEGERESPQAMLLDAESLRAMGLWDEAIPVFLAAAVKAPQRLEPWLGRGWCLKRLGRLGEAVAALEEGLQANPNQPVLHYNLACYHSLAGEVSSAIEHLTKAISIDRRFRDLTQIEPDFDPIRSDPRFVAATHMAC
jgi:tetratricopeptide (TPR) repeat protein